jgi:3',5'-cyclic AMP phosphodiesterase CpdA
VQSLAPDASDAVEAKVVSRRLIGGIEWFFLDSLERVNGVRGRLGAEQRAWLKQRLDANGGPAIICVHHNPERSLVGLKDTDEFLSVVLPRRRVKAVLFGHTHEFRVWTTDGLHFVNLPAVGYRFLDPNVLLGWVSARVDGYGMHLEVRGVTSGERGNGARHVLRWRGETA